MNNMVDGGGGVGNGLPSHLHMQAAGGIAMNYRGDNSISNAQLSHSSAASAQQQQQQQRPSSLGGNNQSTQQQQHAHMQAMMHGVGYQGMPDMNYKYPNGMIPGGGMVSGNNSAPTGERPMSRGNINGQSSKIPPVPPQQQMNGGGQPTYQISQDQQNFHLPPGAFQNGMPISGGGGNGQPTFHFIANKQKFYAQITPDKAAPLLFSEKRPFTAANPLIMQGASNTVTSGFQPKRGNSHNSKQAQMQAMNAPTQQQQQQQPLQPYQNPYHLQAASKTHTGTFGLQNQMLIHNAPKYVSSAAQLDNTPQQQQQLVSIFAQQNAIQPPLAKMKVKPPNRNNIKEKEQLYEDAIKLKIQLNSYREENVRLKTKIKILENDMSKQERAMEEFIAKFQLNNGQQMPSPNQPPLSSPLPGGNNNLQTSSNPGSATSNNRDSNNPQHMISLISGSSGRPQGLLQQNETFLVMSLKKQVKELKFECLKKDEELEGIKKSLKSTKQQEFEVEVKSYIEECQRLRQLLQDMLHQGPKHPLYQERLGQLEQQRQTNEYMVASLQAQNQELARALQAKDEELGLRAGDKAARKEMKQELSKAKKTLREREKELVKLRAEVQSTKKAAQPPIAMENNSFTNKDSTPGTQQKQVDTDGDKQQPGSASSANQQAQQQLKLLQKKVKELQNESRGRKMRIEELESEQKKQTDKLQKAMDDSRVDAKKIKQLEDEVVRLKKQQNGAVTTSSVPTTQPGPSQGEVDLSKYKVQLEILSLTGKRDKLSHAELCRKLISDSSYAEKALHKEVPKDLLSSETSLLRHLPYYVLLSDSHTLSVFNDAFSILKKHQPEISQKFALDSDVDSETFFDFKPAFINLTLDHIDCLKVKYFDVAKKAKGITLMINLKRFLEDLAQFRNASSTKKTSPAKSKQTPLIVDDDNYEDDEEENIEEDEKDEYEQDGFEDNAAAGEGKKKQEKSPAEGLKVAKKKASPAGKGGKASSGVKKEEDSEEKKGKYMDEEEMLDVAEHCFIRMAESLIEKSRTARSIFTKFSIPEQFPDGTVLELLSPIGFLEGVKEAMSSGGNAASVSEELTEMEAACLLRVLAKPELDNAIILNEFTMIMENFGVPDIYDEEAAAAAKDAAGEEDDDDDYDDYIREEDYYETEKEDEVEKVPEEEAEEGGEKRKEKKKRAKPKRRKIVLNFEELEPKGHKILRKLARFLLERYMHPREFYGPTICRQMIKLKSESHPVDILSAKDFYARMKAAGVRRTVKDDENLTKFLRLDAKFPHLMQMKKVVKALEEIAQVEQKKMQEELAQKKAAAAALEKEKEDGTPGAGVEKKVQNESTIHEEDEANEEDDDEDEEEEEESEKSGTLKRDVDNLRDQQKNMRKKKKKKVQKANMDLMREAGVGNYGYMNDYFAGTGKTGKSGSDKENGSLSAKMAMLMGGANGFTQLNTIEEEKHETQTSNYFRETNGGGNGHPGTVHNMTESERDYENTTNMRGSRILDDDLINTSAKYSPHRLLDGNEFEFPASTKAGGHYGISQSLQQRSLDRVSLPNHQQQAHNQQRVKNNNSEILVDGGSAAKQRLNNLSSSKEDVNIGAHSSSKKNSPDVKKHHYGEEDEDYEEDMTPEKDVKKKLADEVDDDDYPEDEYQEASALKMGGGHKNKDAKEHDNDDEVHDEEEESDYEF